MVIDMGYWSKVLKRLFILILSAIGLYLAIKLSIFYFPFLIAFLIAAMVEPIVRWVAKHTKLQRKTSAIIVLIVVSAIIIGLIVWGVTSLVSEASNLLQALNGYTEKIYNYIQGWIGSIDFSKFKLSEQVSNILQNSTQDLLSVVSNWLKNILNAILQSINKIPAIGVYIVVTLLATYFICADRLYILDQVEHHFPKTWVRRLTLHLRDLLSSLGSYLKAEAILVIIAFFQVLIGLFILQYMGMNVQYPLLAAIGIGFVDALPILGSGSVIVPWAIISALNGDIKLAIGLMIILAVLSVVRQFLEPKIVSKQIGIHPIFTLIAMYTGFQIIGIIGLLIGPIAIIILKNIYGTLIDRGVVKSILDRK